MDRKIILLVFIFLFLISIVVAQPPFEESSIVNGIDIQLNQRFYIPTDTGYTFRVHAFNQSNGIILDNTTTNCTLHFNTPNGSKSLFQDFDYVTADDEYQIVMTQGNFTNPGRYPWVIYCQSNESVGGFVEGLVEIIPGGVELTQARSIIYIGLLGILIFTFLITFFGIGLLPSSNTRDEEGKLLAISMLKYLRLTLWLFEWMLLIAIFYVSSNLSFAFLGEELFAQLLFTLFHITLALTPIIVIIWIVSFFVKILHDKKLNNLMKRGMMGGELP